MNYSGWQRYNKTYFKRNIMAKLCKQFISVFYNKYCTIFLYVFLVFSAQKYGYSQTTDGYKYRIPEKFNDGWETQSLKSAGLDTKKIVSMTNEIIDNKHGNIYGLILVKDGFLVYEEYFKGHSRNTLFTIYSVSKSFTSALVGIAIDKNDRNNSGYGYLWHTGSFKVEEKDINYILGSGFGNHWIMIIRKYNLVIVFNCGGARTLEPVRMIMSAVIRR